MTISNDNTKTDIILSKCTNCGKEGSNLKSCAACKMVEYCSRECQIAHRPRHKKECRRRAAELHDEALFKQPPPKEDCPICFLRLPTLWSGYKYMSCCGKVICSGCVFANKKMNIDGLCPFCRAPSPDEAVMMKRYEKRIDLGDAPAIYDLGCIYDKGMYGLPLLPLNRAKALELWHQAGELGHAQSYHNIGCKYMKGEGVGLNMKKAMYYWELAATRGNVNARHNLGCMEYEAGKMDRALKHYMIASRLGCSDSLNRIREYFTRGLATKDDYANALRAHQAYLDEIRSNQRDEAAAVSDVYKYYY